MSKKRVLIPVTIIVVILFLAACRIGSLLHKGYGISVGRYLETKDGAAMLISGNSPILLSTQHNGDMFYSLQNGDKILVVHDGIEESYPARTRVYSVSKLKSGKFNDIPQNVVNQLIELGWLELENETGEIYNKKDLDVTVSYANWSDDASIVAGAINKDKMYVSSVRHLPLFKMDTKQDLEQFMADYSDILSMKESYDEVPSFEEAISKYNEAFFDENTLFVAYVEANSGSYRFDVNNVYVDADNVCIHVEQMNHPECVTEDMAGWFITVALSDNIIETCNEFDADLNNIE